jgi:dihydrolipoamide dehydrogenase|tara:strand:+ start:433 stop:1713 length:1281 start_codon:yes stop_codon:yes gene_type:complete
MPSKLLIAAGEAAHGVRKADEFGIHAAISKVDGPAVMQRVRRLRDSFAAGVRDQIDDLPDGVAVKASAKFLSANRLGLSDGQQVEAKTIVIATGSASVLPPGFDELGEAVLTNETLFELQALPASIGVIGAGALGLEMAQALSRLGVKVEVFDMSEQIAGMPEGEPETSLRTALENELVFHLGVEPQPSKTEEGVQLSWQEEGHTRTAHFERLLVAAGRAPLLDGLDLEKTGLPLDDHGTPEFDRETLQCGDAPIFIAGDANHDRPILHEASKEGTIAGANAAGFPDVKAFARTARFQIMFTQPNMAVLGEPQGKETVVGRVDYADQGRAKAMGRNSGVCEIYARTGCGTLTGACLVGPDAEHLAHILVWAIEHGATASELLDNPFYHPTVEEGLKTALKQICSDLSLPRPDSRNDAQLPGDFGPG